MGGLRHIIISDERLAHLARRHEIPEKCYPLLRKAIERTASSPQLAHLLCCSRENLLTLRGKGRLFEQFVGALEKAKSLLLKREDVRKQLRYASEPALRRYSIGGHRGNSNSRGREDDEIYESNCRADILAEQYLDELLRIANAGAGSVREEKETPRQNGIETVAVELMAFWQHVLKRPIQINDQGHDHDYKRLRYVEFVDDVLNILSPNADFVRYVRGWKSDIIDYVDEIGIAPAKNAVLQEIAD